MLPMNNLMLVSILSYIFVVALLSFPSPAEAVYLYHICPNTITFTPNSTFQSNLNRLLSTLSSNATRPSGFYNATVSSSSSNDAVYGLFLCRGDVAATDVCKTCVSTATSEAVQFCPTEKQVVIWYDDCMLRYSNESFFSTAAESPAVHMWNPQNATEPTRFNQVLATAMNEVATEAANDADKFATDQRNVSGLVSIYSLGQCTPDLSTADCNGCLRGAIALFPRCCNGKIGGRVFNPSCYVGYEVYPYFYQDSTSVPQPSPGALSPPPPPAAPLPKGKSKHSSINIIVASVVSALLVVLVALVYCFLHRRSRHKYDAALRQENGRKQVKFH